MKNYISDYHFDLDDSLKEVSKEYIKDYQINHDDNTVTINFFNGKSNTLGLSRMLLIVLDDEQERQFKRMQESVTKSLASKFNSTGFIVTCLGGGFALSVISGETFLLNALGVFVASAGAFGLAGAYRKETTILNKEIKLVSYLSENRGIATKIIREEVDKRRVPLNSQNLVFPYPADAPYSQDIYERGLNLSTIDELSQQQQADLKKEIQKQKIKSVFKRERQ